MQHPIPPASPASPQRLHPVRLVRVQELCTQAAVEEREEGSGGRLAWPTRADVAMQATAVMDIMHTSHTPPPSPGYTMSPIPQTPTGKMAAVLDITQQSTAHLMRLSGMLPVVRVSPVPTSLPDEQPTAPRISVPAQGDLSPQDGRVPPTSPTAPSSRPRQASPTAPTSRPQQDSGPAQATRKGWPYYTRASDGAGDEGRWAYIVGPPLAGGLPGAAGLQGAAGLRRAAGLGGGARGVSGVGGADGDIPLPPDGEEGWWPQGIQQTGPLPVVNLYGERPFGQMLPPTMAAPVPAQPVPAWKAFLGKPVVRVTIGLLVGIGLLYLVSKFVDIPETVDILKQNLTTPRGIILALLSGVAFLTAFSIRGVRWKLFLNPVGRVSAFKAIQLFLVGIFLNFLLPIRGGEVAKSLMLKRIAGIPISRSLPTVAMDKALDLMPALFIMALVPLLDIEMDIKLWIVLGIVGGLLVGLIFFVLLAAWKRDTAIGLLQKMTGLLPRAIGSKVEGFATGFVDSLLMGASQPRIFIPAMLLTCVAVIFDGLFAMLAFWTIGYPISFGTAIFGYTVYNMFYILPTPPGQVGSNEAIGLLVFAGLLHLPADKVTAMFVFSHPWAALLMCVTGMVCLSALGLTLSSAMKVQTGAETEAREEEVLEQGKVRVQGQGARV